MAALTDYTTYASVRACLGVSERELKDDQLALKMYVDQFELEMGDVDSGGGAVLSQYTTIKDVALVDRTADQQRFYNILGMLAGYSVARQLCGTIDLFAPKRIEDGRAAVERQANVSEKTVDGVNSGYDTLLKRLKALLLILVPGANVTATAARNYMLAAGLGTDPVTG